jgi:hypothetical protein
MKKHHHEKAYKQHGGKKEKTHEIHRKVMGSGKDGRSGSTKRERRLEKEKL